MARPRKRRLVACEVNATYFKPQGIPMRELDEVSLDMDEVEAIRLADIEGLYHADAALKMGVSRPTFGNIIKSAHKKIAVALLEGKALRISESNDSVRLAQDADDRQPNISLKGETLMNEQSGSNEGNAISSQEEHTEEHQCCGQGHGHSHGDAHECACAGNDRGKGRQHAHGRGRCCGGGRGRGRGKGQCGCG